MLECQSGRGDVEAEFTALLTSGFEEDGRCRQVLVERSQNHGLQASSNQPACAACDDDMSDSADSEARVRLSRRRSRGGLARLGRKRRTTIPPCLTLPRPCQRAHREKFARLALCPQDAGAATTKADESETFVANLCKDLLAMGLMF